MLVDRVIALNRSAKTAMSLAIVLVAAIAMYGWIVSPHVGYLAAVRAYEPAVKEAADKRDLLQKTLGDKQGDLDTVRTELTALRVMLFTPDEARDFFGNIETLCRKAGCTVLAVDFHFRNGKSQAKGSPEPSVAQTCQANLSVSGRYDQIVTLLHDLQARPQRVCIDACRIELVDIRSARLKCDIALTIWAICVGENPDEK